MLDLESRVSGGDLSTEARFVHASGGRWLDGRDIAEPREKPGGTAKLSRRKISLFG